MRNILAGGRSAEVLLVEDNEDDAALTSIAFMETQFSVKLSQVGNGEECMAYLRKAGKYANAPAPDLILLDLNMPRMGGREVLLEVGRDDTLRHLPIVILTTSDSDRDVVTSYKLGCRSYVVKPVDFETFSKLVRGIAEYWFTLVALPL